MTPTERDPWESVPPERRLDYAIADEPLKSLAEAIALRIEREPPPALVAVSGGQPLFVLLARLAQTTCHSIIWYYRAGWGEMFANYERYRSAKQERRSRGLRDGTGARQPGTR